MANDRVTFFHSPRTRSTGTLILLEELGADYDLHLVNMKAGDQRKAEYMAVNPMGKVPAIRYGDALVTEQPAVFIYLADRFAKAGLAPALDDADRGPYLRWMVFYGSSFEPAIVDRALKREQGPLAMSPYGTCDIVLDTLSDQLKRGPYMLGERFSALDILWGTALGWTTMFKVVPERPEYMAYIKRVMSRPSVAKANAYDAEWAAEHEKAAAAAG